MTQATTARCGQGGRYIGRGRRGKGRGRKRGSESKCSNRGGLVQASYVAVSRSGSSSRPTGTPFIGPCTYVDFIFSHGWKKQNNTNIVSPFSGPTSGPSSPVADGAKASDLLKIIFF